MSGFRAGLGLSTAETTEDAVRIAVQRASEQLGPGPAGLALVTCTVDHDTSAVHTSLRQALPDVPIHGATTSLGVLTGAGVATGANGALAVLLLGGDGVRFSTSASPGGDASERAGQDAARGLGDGPPSIVFFAASPGSEEELLRGVAREFPGTPIFGGSAADHAIAGDWSVFTTSGVAKDALSLAAIYGDVGVGSDFVSPYRCTGESARVTSVNGRSLATLDGRPAAETLASWIGDSIQTQLADGGNILAQTALRPLATQVTGTDAPYYRTIHPAHLNAETGEVELFASLQEGDSVFRMEASEAELVDALDGLITNALRAGQLRETRAGVLYYCAGCAGAVGPLLDEGLRQTWGRRMADIPLFGTCVFGEQGTRAGLPPMHCNLSLGLVLFGTRG